MPAGHVYTVKHEAVIATAITGIQLKAGATTPFEILRVWTTQSLAIATAQEKIALVRKSAAATVTIAVIGTHIFKHRPGDPNPDLELSTTATGVIATAEGTDTDFPWEEGFNVLNGIRYVPLPDERIMVEAASFIGLKFRVAPASHTWQMGIVIKELG